MVEQSSQNCTGLDTKHSVTKDERSGWMERKSDWNLSSMSLVEEREGQDRRSCSRVPLWAPADLQQSGKEHIPSRFPGVQCPDRDSTLYLPERNLACVVAFSISHGDDPQVQKMAWHLVRPKYSVLRYCKEGRVSAWSLSLSNQNCNTADLALLFTRALLGWQLSHSEGCGSPYWRQSFLTTPNQDLGLGVAEE